MKYLNYERILQTQVFRYPIFWLGLLLYYLKGLPDFFHWCFGEPERRKWNSNKNQPLHICFITYNARIRECKLAYAAKLCDLRVTLITHKSHLIDNFDDYFAEIYFVKNPWQCLMHINRIKPDIIHLFVNYSVIRLLPVLLFSPVPVVYDPYDCVRGMFKRKFRLPWFEELAEKVCIEKADHLCARSLEPLYLKRKFKYQLPPSTYFPDYCWKPPIKRDHNKINEDDELHVVYIGGINPEDRYPKEVFGFSQYIDVGRALAKQKIHLHLYPANPIRNDQFKQYYSLYHEEAEKNPYFHIHEPITHTKLLEKMKDYDAGLNIYGSEVNYHSSFSISRAKSQYNLANKIFDYVECGLFVVTHSGFYPRGIAKHYSQCIRLRNLNEIRNKLIDEFNRPLRKNNTKAYLDFHKKRLGKMYLSILNQTQKTGN